MLSPQSQLYVRSELRRRARGSRMLSGATYIERRSGVMSKPVQPGRRSPNYPRINLETAIKRAQELYEKEKFNYTSIETAVDHWGFSSSANSSASSTVSALIKFGLLEDTGSGIERRVRLTTRARAILQAPEHEKQEALRVAALSPEAINRLVEMFPNGLPSDQNLEWHLKSEMGFTDKGAGEFLKVLRSTLEYAQVADPSDVRPDSDETTDSELVGESVSAPKEQVEPTQTVLGNAPGQTTPVRIPILLGDGHQLVLEGYFPVSDEAWKVFQAVLKAMEPGLVTTAHSSDGEPEGDVR